jgi:hypothetical protein
MVVIGDYPDSRQLRGVKGLAVIQRITEINSKGNWWAALGYPEASSPLWGF